MSCFLPRGSTREAKCALTRPTAHRPRPRVRRPQAPGRSSLLFAAQRVGPPSLPTASGRRCRRPVQGSSAPIRFSSPTVSTSWSKPARCSARGRGRFSSSLSLHRVIRIRRRQVRGDVLDHPEAAVAEHLGQLDGVHSLPQRLGWRTSAEAGGDVPAFSSRPAQPRRASTEAPRSSTTLGSPHGGSVAAPGTAGRCGSPPAGPAAAGPAGAPAAGRAVPAAPSTPSPAPPVLRLEKWKGSGRRDSNSRHTAWKDDALKSYPNPPSPDLGASDSASCGSVSNRSVIEHRYAPQSARLSSSCYIALRSEPGAWLRGTHGRVAARNRP
jgi:hypothetical protein